MTLDGNTILFRQIVEGNIGANHIRIGGEPSRDPDSEKLIADFSPFLYRDFEFGCNLRVCEGLAGLHHTLADDMEDSVIIGRFTHHALPNWRLLDYGKEHLHKHILVTGVRHKNLFSQGTRYPLRFFKCLTFLYFLRLV